MLLHAKPSWDQFCSCEAWNEVTFLIDSSSQMTATEQWIFLCAAHKTPKECPAIDYTRHTLDGAACLLNSNKYFPSRVSIKVGRRSCLGTILAYRSAYFHKFIGIGDWWPGKKRSKLYFFLIARLQITHYYCRATTERLKENYHLSVEATSLLANARNTLFSCKSNLHLQLREFSRIFDLALPDNLQEKCGTKCNVRLSSKYRQMLIWNP